MKVFFYCLLICLSLGFKHPFYLGVTELKYNAKEKTLQGTVKLFANDIEAALTKLNGKKVDVINPADTSALNKLLKDYLRKHLFIKVNAKNLDYRFIGYERENEVLWLYIESNQVLKPKLIEFENSLLYDFIKEQINIVHLTIGNQNLSSKVTNPERKLRFEFK